MNRTRIILISVIAAIIVIFAVLAIYFTRTSAPAGETSALRDFFTFGRTNPGQTPITPSGTTPSGEQVPGDETITNPITLRQLVKTPVAGATAVYVTRDKPLAPASIGANPAPEWTRNLKEGDTGQDVKELQIFLNQNLEPKESENTTSTQIAPSGTGSPGKETTYFGPATKKAVIVFQEKFKTEILTPQNLTAGTGIVDEKTRIKIHALKDLIPEKETVVAIRYVDSESGTVHQILLDTNEDRRVSETRIPKIHEAFFASSGGTALLRYLNDDTRVIETFAGTVPTVSASGDSSLEMKGSFLPENIASLVISPDGTKIFYLTMSGNNSLGTIASPSGDGRTQPFVSAFTEWNPEWVTSRIIALTTKPSASVPGYAYIFDVQTKEITKVLGSIPGLTTLWSPDGKKVLYSKTRTGGNDFVLSLYDTTTKKSADLGINTLPEKCVWASDAITLYCAIPDSRPRGAYPDIWYQGAISFTDSIWKLDTQTSLYKTLSNPSEDVDTAIDGIHLFLDAAERNLFLTNKKDGSLWLVNLSR